MELPIEIISEIANQNPFSSFMRYLNKETKKYWEDRFLYIDDKFILDFPDFTSTSTPDYNHKQRLNPELIVLSKLSRDSWIKLGKTADILKIIEKSKYLMMRGILVDSITLQIAKALKNSTSMRTVDFGGLEMYPKDLIELDHLHLMNYEICPDTGDRDFVAKYYPEITWLHELDISENRYIPGFTKYRYIWYSIIKVESRFCWWCGVRVHHRMMIEKYYPDIVGYVDFILIEEMSESKEDFDKLIDIICEDELFYCEIRGNSEHAEWLEEHYNKSDALENFDIRVLPWY